MKTEDYDRYLEYMYELFESEDPKEYGSEDDNDATTSDEDNEEIRNTDSATTIGEVQQTHDSTTTIGEGKESENTEATIHKEKRN